MQILFKNSICSTLPDTLDPLQFTYLPRAGPLAKLQPCIPHCPLLPEQEGDIYYNVIFGSQLSIQHHGFLQERQETLTTRSERLPLKLDPELCRPKARWSDWAISRHALWPWRWVFPWGVYQVLSYYTMVVGLISNEDNTTHGEEVRALTQWRWESCLSTLPSPPTDLLWRDCAAWGSTDDFM